MRGEVPQRAAEEEIKNDLFLLPQGRTATSPWKMWVLRVGTRSDLTKNHQFATTKTQDTRKIGLNRKKHPDMAVWGEMRTGKGLF